MISGEERLRRAWATRYARFDLATYFWARVDQAGDPTSCWPWMHTAQPYGRFTLHGQLFSTHRVAWELTYGPIPNGLWVLHHCDNPACCKTQPDARWPEGHLFLGTHADNMRDMTAKGRSGLQTKPFQRRRGAEHFAHRHPELVVHGEAHGNAKLTYAQVAQIKARYRPVRGSITELAREFGVHRTTVQHIIKGIVWRDVNLAGPNEDPRP